MISGLLLILATLLAFEPGPSFQYCMGGPGVAVSDECSVYNVDNSDHDDDVDLFDRSIILRVWRTPCCGVLEGRLWVPPNIPVSGHAIIVSSDGSRTIEPLDENGEFSIEVPLGWVGFYKLWTEGKNEIR